MLIFLNNLASKPVKSMALALPPVPFSFGSDSSLQLPSDTATTSQNIPMPTNHAVSKKAAVDNHTLSYFEIDFSVLTGFL
jgi:hypothetical protein